jgi:hypothetical protein
VRKKSAGNEFFLKANMKGETILFKSHHERGKKESSGIVEY